MPTNEAALKPMTEGEQKPLAIAPSTKKLPGAGDSMLTRPIDSSVLDFVETMISDDVDQALENLCTEEQGITEKMRIYQRYCRYISFVSDEVMKRVNGLPRELRKIELERKREEHEPLVQIGNTFEDGSVRMDGGNSAIGGTQHNHK